MLLLQSRLVDIDKFPLRSVLWEGSMELGIWVAIAFLLYTAFSGIKRYLDIRREDRRLEKLIQENRERSGPD
jgi:hypothetical protein